MRWAGLAAAAVVLLAGCSTAPAGPDDGPVLAPDTGVLRGLVVDAALRPLAGANVTAAGAGVGPLTASTGADGLFNFTGVPPGSYAVEVRKATYLSVQHLVQVVAGAAEPDLAQFLLEVEVGEIPFAVAIVWDGLIGCAFGYGNLCSAPAQGGFDVIGDQSAHLFWDEYVAEGRVPDLIQAEATWEPTLPTSTELKPIFGWSDPASWLQFQYGGTFDSFNSASPVFYRLEGERAGEVGLGVEAGLVVEFYSAAPAGVTANQPIRLLLHNFYGYLPPDAWRFVADGPPPGPDSDGA